MIHTARVYAPQTESVDNPIGIDGIECMEFSTKDPPQLQNLLDRLGFTPVARHKTKNILLYRQGDINFLINGEPGSFASNQIAIGLKVKDAKIAYQRLIDRGASPYTKDNTTFQTPTIYGVDGGLIYLFNADEDYQIYKENFEPLSIQPTGHVGLNHLDGITVGPERKGEWTEFFSKLFNFSAQDSKTSLVSPCGRIHIHTSQDPDVQWQISFGTDHAIKTVETLKKAGLDFFETGEGVLTRYFSAKTLLENISFEIRQNIKI
jgi:4-hydroxyphenylpyruvate dioxygenase